MLTKKDCVFRAAMELYEDKELSQMAADKAEEKNFEEFEATVMRGITLLERDLRLHKLSINKIEELAKETGQ